MLKTKKRLLLVLVAGLTFTPMAFGYESAGNEIKPSDYSGPSIRCTEKDKVLAEDSSDVKSKPESKSVVVGVAQ